MKYNNQHIVAHTNEILDPKTGKTLDKVMGNGGSDEGISFP